jgi:hypothetical protein
MKKILTSFLFFTYYFLAPPSGTGGLYAQSVTIDPKNTATNIIDAKSTSQGMMVPKMSTVQKTAIVLKTEGMMVYDTDAHQFSYWTGTVWVNFGNSASAGAGWTQTGNNIANSNSGNVGIGTGVAVPGNKLEINTGNENESGLRIKQFESPEFGNNYSDPFADIPNVTGLATFPGSGDIYATDFTNNKIYKIDQYGLATVFVTAGLSNPHDVINGPDGNIYVSNYGSGTISKITPAGVLSTFASGFSNPIGLTFDTAGNLYIVNNANGNLSKVNAAGTSINLTFGTGLSSPYGCVFNPSDNNIYIANYNAAEVAKFTLSGGAKTTFTTSDVSFCTGITLFNNDLYVSRATPERIMKVTMAGVSSIYALTSYPFDLMFDANNFLYIANQTINKVSIIKEILNNVLSVNAKGDVVKQNNIGGWVQVGNELQNRNTDLTIINSKPSLLTNAVFGSNGTGISLQKNWPGVGYNSYRDAANVQRYMGTGFGMVTALDQVNGTFFWNKMGNGAAGNAVGANEQYIAGLTQAGEFQTNGKIAIGTFNYQNRFSIGPMASPGFLGNDIFIGEKNGLGSAMSFFQSGAQTTGASIWYSNSNFSLMPAGAGTGRLGIGKLDPTSKLDIEGSISKSFRFIGADYTPTEQDHTIIANMQEDGNKVINITLPPPALARGRVYIIRGIQFPKAVSTFFGSFQNQRFRYEREDNWTGGEPSSTDKGYIAIKDSNGELITCLFKQWTSFGGFLIFGGATSDAEQRTCITIQSIGTRWIVTAENYFLYHDSQ